MTRIGRGGRPDRALRLAAAVVVVGLGLALAKPWGWGSPATPLSAPGATGTPGPAPASPPAPPAWTDIGATASCLSNRLWLAVVDETAVDGRTVARSWTRLDPVPAAGPDDPAIARIHVYADTVPRLGFCAPTGTAGAAPDGPLAVTAWRLDPAVAPGTAPAAPIEPVVVAGGRVADSGALLGPPAGLADRAAAGQPGDPEAAWSADGIAPWRPAGWSTGAAPVEDGWQPGTYVFRVELPGAGPDGSDEAWLAVELRGPWPGPDLAAPPMSPSPVP